METPEHAEEAATNIGKRLITRKQLLKKVPLSERTILNLENRGEFPRRFPIAERVVAWDLDEVEAWIAERKAAGIQLPAPGKAKAAAEQPERSEGEEVSDD